MTKAFYAIVASGLLASTAHATVPPPQLPAEPPQDPRIPPGCTGTVTERENPAPMWPETNLAEGSSPSRSTTIRYRCDVDLGDAGIQTVKHTDIEELYFIEYRTGDNNETLLGSGYQVRFISEDSFTHENNGKTLFYSYVSENRASIISSLVNGEVTIANGYNRYAEGFGGAGIFEYEEDLRNDVKIQDGVLQRTRDTSHSKSLSNELTTTLTIDYVTGAASDVSVATDRTTGLVVTTTDNFEVEPIAPAADAENGGNLGDFNPGGGGGGAGGGGNDPGDPPAGESGSDEGDEEPSEDRSSAGDDADPASSDSSSGESAPSEPEDPGSDPAE